MESLSVSAVLSVLQMLGQLVLQLSSNAQVDAVVTGLLNWIPIIAKSFPDLLSEAEQLLAIVEGSDTLTADQVTALASTRASLEAARAALNASAAPVAGAAS